ncbi:MAG: thioredoxin [Calditrichaeota bacterium]|nr:MAG: thioredoxin [Calditrichota bacterium]
MEKSNEIFEKINSSALLVAYFSHAECNICKVLRPKVKELVSNYPDVDFLYIDIYENPVLRGQMLVFAVPTIIFFINGREVKRFNRHISIQDITELLNRISGE